MLVLTSAGRLADDPGVEPPVLSNRLGHLHHSGSAERRVSTDGGEPHPETGVPLHLDAAIVSGAAMRRSGRAFAHIVSRGPGADLNR